MVCRSLATAVLVALGALVGACSGEDQDLPPTAHPQIVEMLRAELEVEPHPADRTGRGWLVVEESDVPAVASRPGRWTIEYEAGPLGIDVGGMLFLQVSPFWGWSTPQVLYPEGPGYTQVTTDADGVEIEPETVDQQLLGVTIGGRRLEAGETIRFVYGAGASGARADRYAERESRFWLAVDGNGDGYRSVLPDSPSIEVVAEEASGLLVHLSSSARSGEAVRLTVAAVDGSGNRATDFVGTVELGSVLGATGEPGSGELDVGSAIERWPTQVVIGPGDRGAKTLTLEAPPEGIVRVVARTAAGLEAESNPLVVSESPAILWADLHGHSGLSDGTGVPEDYLSYARDVAGLDVVALTDHDHWGVEPLATHPRLWEEISRQAERFNEPGRFVALRGYEWTNWIFGHRHVLYFDDAGEVLSAVDHRYDHPQELWNGLRGASAMTFAHHSAGGPVATDWRIPPDPVLEPLTEIVSVHGSSEAPDSPLPIYRPLAGNFVRDVLDRGYRLGFVGSGDGHDGHPGMTHFSSRQMGGVAAIFAEDLSREAILEALRARRTYATNGPRIVLRTLLDGAGMGSLVPSGSAKLEVEVVGVGPLMQIDVVRSGALATAIDCAGATECEARVLLEGLAAGEYVYVRAVQEDGGAAWSSPFFVE